jgi:hypothetical protein
MDPPPRDLGITDLQPSSHPGVHLQPGAGRHLAEYRRRAFRGGPDIRARRGHHLAFGSQWSG